MHAFDETLGATRYLFRASGVGVPFLFDDPSEEGGSSKVEGSFREEGTAQRPSLVD